MVWNFVKHDYINKDFTAISRGGKWISWSSMHANEPAKLNQYSFRLCGIITKSKTLKCGYDESTVFCLCEACFFLCYRREPCNKEPQGATRPSARKLKMRSMWKGLSQKRHLLLCWRETAPPLPPTPPSTIAAPLAHIAPGRIYSLVSLITRLRWLQEKKEVLKVLINTNYNFPHLDWHLSRCTKRLYCIFKMLKIQPGGVLVTAFNVMLNGEAPIPLPPYEKKLMKWDKRFREIKTNKWSISCSQTSLRLRNNELK